MRGYGNPGTQFGTPVDPNGRPIGLEAFHPTQTMLANVNADGKRFIDKGADGYHSSVPAALGMAKTIYISRRTDDHGGSGLPMDALDGSTQQKFDAICRANYLAGLTNITFILGEATEAAPFKFIGGWDVGAGESWLMLSGWRFRGQGKGKTYVEQVVGDLGIEAGDGNNPLFSAGPLHNQDNQEVSGMTIKCGWFIDGPGATDPDDRIRPYGNFSAVFLYGENCKIDVDASGMGWVEDENFGCWIAGGHNGLHLPHHAELSGKITNCGDNCSGWVATNYSATHPINRFTVNTTSNLITTENPHGLAANDIVRLDNNGGGLPSPGARITDYYVIASGLTATTLKVSLTEGGSAVDFTTAGTGTHDLWKHSFTYAKGGCLHDWAYEGTGEIGDGAGQGGGLGGFDGAMILRGYVSGAAHAYFDDTFSNKDCTIDHFTTRDCGNPILVNCKFPQINTRVGAHCVLAGTEGSALFGDIQGGVVDGPRFVDEDPDGGSLWWSTNSPTIQSLMLINCKPDEGMTFDEGAGVGMYFAKDNRTPSGAAIGPSSALGAVCMAESDNSSVPQIIADTATGFFGLDSQSLDLGGIMDGTTDRITAPGAGVMELDFCVYFSTVTSAGYVQLRIYKNGSTTGMRVTRMKAPTTDNTYHMVKARIAVVAGDYFKLAVENQTGASLTISADGNFSFASAKFTPASSLAAAA